jgi:hypothetical protein
LLFKGPNHDTRPSRFRDHESRITFHSSPRPLHHSDGIARSLGEIRVAIVRGSIKRLKRRTIADRPECGGRLTLDLTILVGRQEPD